MEDESLRRRAELARPDVSADEARAILQDHYNLSGDLTELGSQQDRNYRVDTGESRFVLKVARAEYARVELEAQNAALRHIGERAGAPMVPQVVPARSGEAIVTAAVGGETYQFRLLTYLEGTQLTRRKHLALDTVAALGDLAGRLAVALKDFDHPGLERELQWDLRRAGPVALQLLSAIADVDLRERVAKAMAGATRRVEPLAPELRLQAVHHDVTDDNVVSRAEKSGRLIPEGVIDFGDLLKGWLVADLAVTCSSLLHHGAGDPFCILPAVKAFCIVCPLTDAELKALWPLIVARAGVLVASSAQQLEIEPDNAYVQGNAAHEREIFEVAASVPFELMEQAIHQAAGRELPSVAFAVEGSLLPGINPDRVGIVDLSLLGPHLSEDRWLDEGAEAQILQSAARAAGAAATRYGEFRFTETRLLQPKAPRTFAQHVDLCLQGQTAVHAPFAGQLHERGGRLILSSKNIHLHLLGVAPAGRDRDRVEAGEQIGTIPADPAGLGFVRVQLCTAGDIDPPPFAAAHQANAWRRLCPSPAKLLGIDCDAPMPDTAALLDRRRRHFARPQKNYYREPPQIERGFQEHLFDVEGRAYLDMVNNVTLVGHGHPRLSAAVGRQWSRLNTNSRFHYAAVAEFSERLAGLAPEGLDTVFLVNSGSEANDLAIRLAWAYAGARDMLSLLEAYHGWTVASDAVSTSIADNPQALTTRPSWVHPVVSPNTYRGPYRGEGSTGDYVRAVTAKLKELDEKGGKLAGFICEAVYGNAGGIPLPPGYLDAVYAMVRARGGVCIADEVQVGYGRLGRYFWGFEEQGVVPDVITVAKGMGNGHPLGAVITRREIADALEKEGYFFSSAGGSPVSSVVGLTVLEILRDEALQENARAVGDHLKERLHALGQRFSIVGAVHGMGLYLGVEFVRDRETLEPATEETAAICDRLLDLGVIMQPTGDHLNVLKIKPPLCLSRDSADFFADVLERVLEDGW
jgi:4-aminobutyrate aminotransferase-like enzyme/Ser/Thr protein kinase RdoA (MazF antagonist)